MDSLNSIGPSRQGKLTSVQGLSYRWSSLLEPPSDIDVAYRASSKYTIAGRDQGELALAVEVRQSKPLNDLAVQRKDLGLLKMAGRVQKAEELKPDLILLDIGLPTLRGTRQLDKFANLPWNPK